MTNDEDTKDDVGSFYDIVADTLKEWTKKHCLEEKKLRRAINQQLNKHFDHIIYTSLGFTNKWGSWEIDNKNNHSVVGNYIQSNIKKEVDEWIGTQAKDIKNLHLKPEMAESLQAEAERIYTNHIRDFLRTKVIAEADKVIQSMVDKVKLDEEKIREGTKALEFISVFSKVAVPEDDKDKK